MLIERKKNDNITFARDKFLIYGMEHLGCKISFFEQKSNWILRQLKLIKYCFSKRNTFDALFVSSRCKTDLLVAKFCSIMLRKPLIADVFISTYNTQVEDRKLVSSKSVKGRLLKLFDLVVVLLSDAALLDTNSHINYFEENIWKAKKSIKKYSRSLFNNKYYRVLIGSDSREHPVDPDNLPKKDKKCIVFYNGTYIPLHGVEYLLEAAAILQKNPEANNVEFLFYGDGQQRKEMVALSEKLGLNNVKFNFDFKEEELQNYIHKSTIYLGIFGNTDKAKRVIPCKVYKGMVMHACVLSGHSDAMGELFVEGEEYLGAKFADGSDIAEKILLLANNNQLREKIAAAGYHAFLEKSDISSVAKELKKVFLDFGLIT